jgi:hypothetical protein
MQINLDITIGMPCDAIHVNVQDAVQDRILAGDLLQMDPSVFEEAHAHALRGGNGRGRVVGEEHVGDVMRLARKTKFMKTRLLYKGEAARSCRVFGSLDVNRMQGDIHVTAKGHGYWDGGAHIDHRSMSEIYPPGVGGEILGAEFLLQCLISRTSSTNSRSESTFRNS